MSSLKRSFSEKRIDDSAVNPVIKKISSRILPGALTPANKDAVDWGFQSLLAYGCHKHVVVIDTRYTQVFQTLTGHKHNVTKVNWSRNLHYHDLVNPYHLKLASADTSGTVLVWDVSLATVRSTLVEPDRTVLELGWLLGGDSNHHLLLALYSLGTLVLWHADTGAQVWRKCYTEPPVSFSLDPFCESTVLFLAADHLLLVEDLNGQQAPAGSGHKWSLSSVAYSPSEEKSKPRSRLISGVKSLIRTGDNRTGIEEALPLNECLQLCYHRAVRHQLFLVYPKKIFVVDTEVQQVLGVIPLERNGSAFVCCHPCWECDFLLCLHESGSVSARFRHEDNESLAGALVQLVCVLAAKFLGETLNVVDLRFMRGSLLSGNIPPLFGGSGYTYSPILPGYSLNRVKLDQASGLITYDTLCISEALRLSKHSKVNGMAVCQSSQCKVALLLGDGRIVFLKMALSGKVSEVDQTAILTSMMKGNNTGTLRLLTTGLLEGLAPGPHLSRMCPPVTFGNWSTYRPLLAVGNTTGSVQVFDLSSGTLEKELNLHATPVRGIEWVSLTSFLSFAYANLITVGSKVRNEIVLTSIQSGRVQQVRADANEESPVTCIKVSHLKQYFVVLFKDQPFELWDLRSLVLLRNMPDSFPCVTALEWSPLVSSKAQLRARHLANSKDVEPIFANSATEQLERQLGQQAASPLLREQLVFTDTEAQLYYFSVEGNVVRDCTRNPPEAGMSSVTSIAWKSDHIVLGDAEGTLTVWDLKGKVLRALPTQRGHVKKLKFAPGKGNMKILALFTDGISAWDAQDVQLFVQVRCPQDLPGITDVDWAKSDKLVVATSDGCIRIMDMEMKSCSSPVSNHLQTSRVPFVPQLLPPKAALQLKSLLQHPDMGPATVPSPLSEEASLHERLQQASLQCKAPSKAGVIERNVAVASWFGDEEGFHFWSVTQYYITKKQRNLNTSAGTSLPLCYDMLCPDAEYKALQLKRLLFHERQRMVHSHTQRCVCRLLLLGQADQAVQLLLETEAASEHFYSDSLRACLVASLKTESKAQSVVKLVATNLIANGRTWDGVQLLCLIGKGLDACRYLQAAGQWEDSVWLAKEWYVFLHQSCEASCLDCIVSYKDPKVSREAQEETQGIVIEQSMASSGDVQLKRRAVIEFLAVEGCASINIHRRLTAVYGDACVDISTVWRWARTVKDQNPAASNLHTSHNLPQSKFSYSPLFQPDVITGFHELLNYSRTRRDGKCTLSDAANCEVISKWAEHLIQQNQKGKAVLVLLSVGQYARCLQTLHAARMVERAALFLDACLEHGLLPREHSSLFQNVWLDYARYLHSLGNKRASLHYCSLAGEAATDLRKEVEMLLDEEEGLAISEREQEP